MGVSSAEGHVRPGCAFVRGKRAAGPMLSSERWFLSGCYPNPDFKYDGKQYALRFQEKGSRSREILVRHDLEGYTYPRWKQRASPGKRRTGRCSGRRTAGAGS